MSQENKSSNTEINSELEAKLIEKMNQMQNNENQEDKGEIEFNELEDVSGGAWYIAYRT